ncbi:MAG: hypothetical protein P4L56_22545 [Candidatus Sulfopaludibacter sp.]|nr:hypothetical protein [Candidatus Sulfopaludibacter sp.]
MPYLSYRLRQFLPNPHAGFAKRATLKGCGTNLEKRRKMKNRIGAAHRPAKAPADAARPEVGHGIRRRAIKGLALDPGRDRVQSFHPEERLTATEIVIPEEIYEGIPQKPLCGRQTSERQVSDKCLLAVRLPIAAEGRFERLLRRFN